MRKSWLGKSKGTPFSFPFSFRPFFRRIRSLLDSSSAILIVIPRLSLSRGKKEKWDVLFWLLWFPTDGAQKQMVLVLPLYGSYIQPVIISRGLHYRPGLKIEEWRGLLRLRVKGMMVHPRPLQVCLHLLCVPSGFHGLFVLPQLLMVVSFSFPFWIVALFSSRDLISTPTQEKS